MDRRGQQGRHQSAEDVADGRTDEQRHGGDEEAPPELRQVVDQAHHGALRLDGRSRHQGGRAERPAGRDVAQFDSRPSRRARAG